MEEYLFHTRCCVVGGGPAGVMTGLLLARRGVSVTVLEKHRDFNRDFRGDTVHASTLEVMRELGFLDEFLALPHSKIHRAGGIIGGHPFTAAKLDKLPTHCRFIALMPQWDLLNFLSGKAKTYSGFDLRMNYQATGLVEEDGRVTGVVVRTPSGVSGRIGADLVIGCDGRHAITRAAGHLDVIETGVPIDVLWFRISRTSNDTDQVFGNLDYGVMLILINRGDYFQAGMIIRKGSFEEIKAKGLAWFREKVRQVAPYLGDRVNELQDWDQIKLLTVQINRLKKWWRPGLLCIGDAAHAMSPVFGVGINLAIQDAIATANILAGVLARGEHPDAYLYAIQKRREFPARVIQFLQVLVHRGLQQVFKVQGPMKQPVAMRVVLGIPGFQDVMGRVIAVGPRPEHVTLQKRSKLGALLSGLRAGLRTYLNRAQGPIPAVRSPL